MTTINLKKYSTAMLVPLLAGLLATYLLWLFVKWLQDADATIGTIDIGIFQVILLALGTWLVVLGIALVLVTKLFIKLQNRVEPLKTLTSWQQHILYLALFAVLLFSGTGCLMAIC